VILLKLELIGQAVLDGLSTEEVAVQRRVLHSRRRP
jgi:hypothetical protein